ncbi:MAG: AraC family transcriptional regulator [Bacteroidota bacterium]
MVQNRDVFKYRDKILIEKITIETPFRYTAIFQNDGCFLYIKGKDTKLFSSETNLNIKEREAVLLKCGTYIADWLGDVDGLIEVIAVHLYPNILKQLYKDALPKVFKKRKDVTQVKTVIPDDTMKRFIESLEFYFQNPTMVSEDLLELKIKELMLLLVQTKSASSVLELVEELYSTRVPNFKRTVELHTYENLSIEELAGLCGLSLSSFKREFKAIYEDSPKNYLTNKKVQKAKSLLATSDLTIGEVAYEVGFTDPYYFTRLFKKKEYLTPSAFRKKSQN